MILNGALFLVKVIYLVIFDIKIMYEKIIMFWFKITARLQQAPKFLVFENRRIRIDYIKVFLCFSGLHKKLTRGIQGGLEVVQS